MKEQTITIPSNMELVKVSETEYKIAEKKKELPSSWKEFCEMYPLKEGEAFISTCAEINTVFESRGTERVRHWFNLLPNKEYAEAILALCQLIQLRDCYRQGWKPDWSDGNAKYCIKINSNHWKLDSFYNHHNILSFQTEQLRDKFYNNFKDLIKKITPLFI